MGHYYVILKKLYILKNNTLESPDILSFSKLLIWHTHEHFQAYYVVKKPSLCVFTWKRPILRWVWWWSYIAWPVHHKSVVQYIIDEVESASQEKKNNELMEKKTWWKEITFDLFLSLSLCVNGVVDSVLCVCSLSYFQVFVVHWRLCRSYPTATMIQLLPPYWPPSVWCF